MASGWSSQPGNTYKISGQLKKLASMLRVGVYLFPNAGEVGRIAQADRAQYTLYQINDTQHRQRMKYP